ncbi:hypothetical protein GCM10027521_02510 [Amycolatopsis cihanbeyliensis]
MNVRMDVQVVGEPSMGDGVIGEVEVDLRLSCGAVIRGYFCDGDLGPDGTYPLRAGVGFYAELVPASLAHQPWEVHVMSVETTPS